MVTDATYSSGVHPNFHYAGGGCTDCGNAEINGLGMSWQDHTTEQPWMILHTLETTTVTIPEQPYVPAEDSWLYSYPNVPITTTTTTGTEPTGWTLNNAVIEDGLFTYATQTESISYKSFSLGDPQKFVFDWDWTRSASDSGDMDVILLSSTTTGYGDPATNDKWFGAYFSNGADTKIQLRSNDGSLHQIAATIGSIQALSLIHI